MTNHFEVRTVAQLEEIGAITAIQDGNHGERHPKVDDYVEDGIPFVMAKDIRNDVIEFSGCARISEQQARSLRIGFAQNGDVLLTHKGTVGNVAIVENVEQFVMLTPQVTYYRTDNTLLLNRFLAYAFREPRFQARLRAFGAQGTRPYIGITAQRQLQVVYAPPSTQSRIVDLLRPYDELIENNRRRIQLLEEAARLLYREWFVHLRYPGHEHDTIRNGVPEGWKLVPLSALCEDIRQQVQPTTVPPGTPYIGLEHIPRRSITLDDWGCAEDVTSSKFRFESGDILFGKIRPYFHKVGFALVDGITSSDAIVIRAKEEKLYAYCLLLTSSDGFIALTSKTVREGSKMPRADWKYLKSLQFPRPPDNLLLDFTALARPMLQQLRNLALQNHRLQECRDILLPRLMSGEVEV